MYKTLSKWKLSKLYDNGGKSYHFNLKRYGQIEIMLKSFVSVTNNAGPLDVFINPLSFITPEKSINDLYANDENERLKECLREFDAVHYGKAELIENKNVFEGILN